MLSPVFKICSQSVLIMLSRAGHAIPVTKTVG